MLDGGTEQPQIPGEITEWFQTQLQTGLLGATAAVCVLQQPTAAPRYLPSCAWASGSSKRQTTTHVSSFAYRGKTASGDHLNASDNFSSIADTTEESRARGYPRRKQNHPPSKATDTSSISMHDPEKHRCITSIYAPTLPTATLNPSRAFAGTLVQGQDATLLTIRELASGDSRPVKKSGGIASELAKAAPPFAPAAVLAPPPAAVPPPPALAAAAPLAAAVSSCLLHRAKHGVGGRTERIGCERQQRSNRRHTQTRNDTEKLTAEQNVHHPSPHHHQQQQRPAKTACVLYLPAMSLAAPMRICWRTSWSSRCLSTLMRSNVSRTGSVKTGRSRKSDSCSFTIPVRPLWMACGRMERQPEGGDQEKK